MSCYPIYPEVPILHTLIALLALLAHAAAALPLIAVLTIISARRGNAPFCLWGAAALLQIALCLAVCGPLWLGCSYWAEVLPYGAPLGQALQPLLHAPGLPWSSSCFAWLLAWVFIYLGSHSLKRLAPPANGQFPLKLLLPSIALNLAAALCVFLAYILINWPFAGFPPELEQSRAIMAIARNAMRTYFMGFCQAGAITLAALPFYGGSLDERHLFIAVRWLSFWAVVGCLPHIMVTWGASIGIGLRSPAAFAQSLIPQTSALAALTLALGLWAFMLWKPQYWRILAPCALGLLLLRTLLPLILRIF